MSTAPRLIDSPDSPELAELCSRLSALADELDRTGCWPAEQLRLCGEYGVYEWFLDAIWGGQNWVDRDVVRGYLALSAACLTTTFIMTQRTGACRRIASSENENLKQRLLPDLVSGHSFATVGISHLTTSRRHLARPVLAATRTSDGFLLNGFSPWVTGGQAADTIVMGATMLQNDQPTSEQILLALPTDTPGVAVAPAAELVGVSASHTGQVQLDSVEVGEEQLLAGPTENVMSGGAGANTGGLETSTLAIGLSKSAIDYIEQEQAQRPDLKQPFEALQSEYEGLENKLLALSTGEEVCSKEELRTQANSLALRSTQAALAAAKGAGYVTGHPAGRWCREALFFLVWSCPQPVAAANLCELAGIQH